MMVNPTKREKEIFEMIEPWQKFDAKTEIEKDCRRGK